VSSEVRLKESCVQRERTDAVSANHRIETRVCQQNLAYILYKINESNRNKLQFDLLCQIDSINSSSRFWASISGERCKIFQQGDRVNDFNYLHSFAGAVTLLRFEHKTRLSVL